MVKGSRRFGNYIRSLREARRLTLEDVERMTAGDPEPVTRSLLSRMENGKSRISAWKLLALSRLYGVRTGLLAEHLELSHEMGQAEPADTRLVQSMEDLFAEARDAAAEGRSQRALVLFSRAETAAQERGVTSLRVRGRLGMARSLLTGGRLHIARGLLEELIVEDLSAADRAWTCFLLTRVLLELRRPLLARGTFLTLQELERPWPREIESYYPRLAGDFLELDGQLDEAIVSWLEALNGAKEMGDSQLELETMLRIASTELLRQRTGSALDWASRALRLARTQAHSAWEVRAQLVLGRVLMARERPDAARDAWVEGRRLARSINQHGDLFAIYVELWRLAVRRSDGADARACLRSLRHLARLLDAIPPACDDVRAALDRLAAAELPVAATLSPDALRPGEFPRSHGGTES